MKHSTLILWLTPLLMLALACGGGSESNSSADSVTTTIDGILDFDSVESVLSKTRQSTSLGGNVTLTNQDANSNVLIVAPFSSNTFSADVPPGDYEVLATRNDNTQLRSYLPSVTTGSNTEVNIDADTTTAAIYIDIYEQDIRSADNILAEVKASDTKLLDASTDDTASSLALIFNYLKHEVKERFEAQTPINRDTIVTALNTTSVNENIRSTGAANLLGHLSGGGNTIYLPFAVSSNPANMDLSTFEGNVNTTFPVSTTGEKVVVVEVAPDYSSSALTIIDANSGNINFNNGQAYPISDVTVDVYGRHLYPIGRFNADFVEKRDIDNLGINLYGSPYSTLDVNESNSVNPNALIFTNGERALLTRYDSGTQWIVNPSATSSSTFKVSEVDLSAYDSDGVPEISQGVSISGNTFLAAQRLTNYLPSDNAYLIVIDASGNEINTGMAEAGSDLNGIQLPARNSGSVIYNSTLNKIFVQCTGQYGASWNSTNREFTGGIVTVDPDTYETQLLIDDDAGADLSSETLTGGGTYGGLINGMAIVSATKGYLLIYSGWQDVSLRSFNPTTGEVSDPIEGFANQDLSSLAVDSQGRLWVGSGSSIMVLNSSTDTLVQTTSLNLNVSTLKILSY